MGAVTVTDLQARQIREQRLKGCGYKAIASAVGLSRDLVRNYCRSNGLDGHAEVLAADDQAHRDIRCPNCGKPLTQPRTGRRRKFCSDACRRSWWSAHPATLQRSEGALYQMTCICCGKTFIAYGNQNRRFCSRSCYIQNRFRRSELS
ncbi:MAG: RNA polymerase subunit sigma-70 [Christensenellaceae bacterium]|nr:RNA polymerase subunit sigma-70 [Christensenellaceae bacterium]MEA5068829.1 RNA polymerase subunit sigma-70 [Christensenellaceae bacterium]